MRIKIYNGEPLNNHSTVKLKSKEDIEKKLVENNLQLERKFKLHKVDIEDITESNNLHIEQWGHLSPSPDYMKEKKKAQRRKEYWDSKVRDDLLPNLNLS